MTNEPGTQSCHLTGEGSTVFKVLSGGRMGGEGSAGRHAGGTPGLLQRQVAACASQGKNIPWLPSSRTGSGAPPGRARGAMGGATSGTLACALGPGPAAAQGFSRWGRGAPGLPAQASGAAATQLLAHPVPSRPVPGLPRLPRTAGREEQRSAHPAPSRSDRRNDFSSFFVR